MKNLNPVQNEIGVDVRGCSGLDAAGVGGDEAKLASSVSDGDEEGSVAEGEEVAVADVDGEMEGDVDGGEGFVGVDSDVVELDSDDFEFGIGGPEEEDGGGEEEDGEDEAGDAATGAEKGGGLVVRGEEDVVDAAVVAVGIVVEMVVVVVLGRRGWWVLRSCFCSHFLSSLVGQESGRGKEEEELIICRVQVESGLRTVLFSDLR